MRPPPVYSEKDMREANERLAAVDTRSIKKVAEAKFRKKKRAETKMAQARKRASTIMEQDDVPDVSNCLLYTSPSPRDLSTSRMPSSA